MKEVQRTQEKKLGWPPRLTLSFQQQLHRAFPEAVVHGWEPLVENLVNDPKDRHVLAAAIRGGAQLILMFNLKHFSENALTLWGLQVCHPQDYLLTLYELDPVKVMTVLGEIAGRKQMDVEKILLRMGAVLPCFVRAILEAREG